LIQSDKGRRPAWRLPAQVGPRLPTQPIYTARHKSQRRVKARGVTSVVVYKLDLGYFPRGQPPDWRFSQGPARPGHSNRLLIKVRFCVVPTNLPGNRLISPYPAATLFLPSRTRPSREPRRSLAVVPSIQIEGTTARLRRGSGEATVGLWRCWRAVGDAAAPISPKATKSPARICKSLWARDIHLIKCHPRDRLREDSPWSGSAMVALDCILNWLALEPAFLPPQNDLVSSVGQLLQQDTGDLLVGGKARH
jgi:hypothetical protein